MGATESHENLQGLNLDACRRPGLNDQEIVQLYQIFQGLGPNKDGLVKTTRVKHQYAGSMDKNDFDAQFGDSEYISWDSFFGVMSNDILEKKRKFGDVQFDSSARDVGCVFCPYTVDNRQE